MYLKDKERRITLRLNEEQFDFISRDCDMLGITPSAYLRMIINSTMSITKQTVETFKSMSQQVAKNDDIGVNKNAENNDKDNFDNIV